MIQVSGVIGRIAWGIVADRIQHKWRGAGG